MTYHLFCHKNKKHHFCCENAQLQHFCRKIYDYACAHSSMAFEDLLASSIAPQVMLTCWSQASNILITYEQQHFVLLSFRQVLVTFGVQDSGQHIQTFSSVQLMRACPKCLQGSRGVAKNWAINSLCCNQPS